MIGGDPHAHVISLPSARTFPAAARSASNDRGVLQHTPGRDRRIGSQQTAHIGTFSPPVTSHRMRRARLMTG